MHVLVNALSVTNLSGRHVLLGHLERLATWTRGEHEFDVIYHAGNRDICRDLGANVRWVECSSITARWPGRVAWEASSLSGLAKRLGSDFMFTPSGTYVPRMSLPQVVFAQNPWALVSGVERTPAQQIKAALQRQNYRQAVKRASLMFFNSEYMRAAYRENACCPLNDSEVVYQALDDATHDLAKEMRALQERKSLQIVSVSAMAPHKGVETLVNALATVRQDHGLPAELVLVGAWPDAAYAKKIRSLVQNLGLESGVTIKGHVSRQELNQLYAESKVFALMSHCESFGIPAVEAQVFGTPVVSSNCCAIPEVCGEGGFFPQPGDAEGTAARIAQLLSDDEDWTRLSDQAITNASRFRWDLCSRPLLRMFERDFS
jgi:glycosyltransferase involved in cell wall biosynthesis